MQMESLASQSSFNLDGPEVECMADFLCGLRYVSALHDHKKLTDSAYMDSFVQISEFTKKFKGPLFVGSKKLTCFSETIAAAVMSSPHWKEMVDSIEAVDQALLEGQKRVKEAEDELTANALDLAVDVDDVDAVCTNTTYLFMVTAPHNFICNTDPSVYEFRVSTCILVKFKSSLFSRRLSLPNTDLDGFL